MSRKRIVLALCLVAASAIVLASVGMSGDPSFLESTVETEHEQNRTVRQGIVPAKTKARIDAEFKQSRSLRADAARREAVRERKLASPKLKREREASRTKFRGLESKAAAAAAIEQQPEVALEPAMSGPRLGEGQELVGFASETLGRIALSGEAKKDAGGKESMLVQSVGTPIAAETKEGVFEAPDTSLSFDADRSAYKPALVNVDSRISRELSGGIEVGKKGTSTSVSFRPAGENVTGSLLRGNKVFFANTGLDTDTIVEATPTGAAVSWLLRSPRAPREQTLDFDLRNDAKLRVLSDGSAQILEGSHPVASISAPVAFDAQKTPLSAIYEVTEDGLAVKVDKGDGDIAYPIAVDPVLSLPDGLVLDAGNDNSSALGVYDGFVAATSSPTAGRVTSVKNTDSNGFPVLRSYAGNPTSAWSYGGFYYDPIRSTSVVRVDWQGVLKPDSGIGLQMGIINSGGWLSNQYGAYYNSSGTLLGAAASQFGAPAGTTLPVRVRVLSCAMDVYQCPARRTGGENTAAYFEVVASAGVSFGQQAHTMGAYVFLADNDNPTLNLTGTLPTEWTDPASVTASFGASDASVGLGNANVGSPGAHAGSAVMWNLNGDGYNKTNGAGPVCDGGATNPCPTSFSFNDWSRLKGKHSASFKSMDLIGNSSAAQNYNLKLDGEAPEIDLSGRLGTFALDASDPNAKPRTIVGNAPFLITAHDGSDKSPSLRRSGVKTLSARLNKSHDDGSEDTVSAPVINYDSGGVAKQNIADCDEDHGGSKNSCLLTYGGTFDSSSLAPGIYYFRVTATDYIGHSSTKAFRIGVGVGKINGVTEGQASARFVPLSVERVRGSATAFRLQFRASSDATARWCELPYAAMKKAVDGSALTSWPQALTSGQSEKLVVDLSLLKKRSTDCASEVGLLPEGPVQFRALMDGSGSEDLRASEDVSVNFDPGGKDTQDDSQDLGLGSVDLVTGNFSMNASDVSVSAYKSDLTVSRTYNSRYTDKTSVLGPGWTLGLPVDGGSANYRSLIDYADVRIPDDERYPAVVVEGIDGSAMTFELAESPNPDGSSKYVPETGLESLKLARTPDSHDPNRTSGFTLTDLDSGEVVEFSTEAAEGEFGEWAPTAKSSPGASNAIRYKYAYLPDGTATVDTAFSSTGTTGITCGDVWDSIPRGCQALHFSYVNVSGDPSLRRLEKITLRTYDPAYSGGAMRSIEVANYAYYTDGTLKEVWDPRISPALKTTYEHTTIGAQKLISKVTPPGEEPFTLSYAKLTEDVNEGRLGGISRSALSAGTATTSVRYYIPTTTAIAASAPFNMTESVVGAWGQDSAPWMAAAVFTPDQPPNGTPATNYDKAQVSYLDPLGREVNALSPGGRLSVTEYDDYGSATRTLSAENRARAMALGSAPDRLAAAEKWDTESTYAAVPGTLQERRHLVKTLGPEHQMRLDDNSWVQGRARTDYTYDEGSPRIGDNTKEPFDLVTTQDEGADVGGTFLDARTTKTEYGSTDAEWNERIPRLVTTDPGSGGLQIKRKVTIEDGLETERFQPRSQSSSEPSTTKTVYYSAGTNSADSACSNRPEWLGLACRRGPGAQPTTSGMPKLPVTYITYNHLRQPLTSSESVVDSGGATKTRSTTATFDAAGRPLTEAITADVSQPIKTTEHIYDPYTGREVQTKSLNGDGSTAKTITRMFDALGRQTNYTDSEGHSSSVSSFDILSRPVTSNDGKETRNSTYDATTGDLTGVSDSGAGSFSASYDSAGRITATTLPGGIVRSLQYDESGSVVYTAYTRTTGCSSNCVLYEQFAVENAHGQYNALWENMQGQNPNNQYYEYDHAGRLTRVQDWRDDSGTYKCTERTYEYDADSNRTKRKVAPETADDCDWGGAGTVQNNSYDSADRQIDAGYVYDAFGRITTVPSADAGSLGDLTATYYASDLVHSVTQGGSTQSFALDPNQRVSVKTKTGGTSSSESYAYADDTDSPAWTATTTGSTTTWSRTVDGIAGADAIQDSATGVKLLLQNIRGDVVAQATTAGALSAVSKVDEFGVPKAALTGKYAFHGSKQREALTSAGVMAMGVRLYQPEAGRFLQVDPVLGGSAGPYDYSYQDPVNIKDLDGRCPMCVVAGVVAGNAAFRLAAAAVGSQAARRIAVRSSTRAAKQLARRDSVLGGRYGYIPKLTKHATKQLVGRDGGRGLANWAYNHALLHGRRTCQADGMHAFESKYGKVIINPANGNVVTVWAKTSKAFHGAPSQVN